LSHRLSGYSRHQFLWAFVIQLFADRKSLLDLEGSWPGTDGPKRLAEPYLQQANEQFELTEQKQRIFTEVEYAAATWDKKRRVVIKAEYNSQGANPRFVVTNLPGDPQALYDDLYCQRGDMENRIKEHQLDLFADRTSCTTSWPTSSACCSVRPPTC